LTRRLSETLKDASGDVVGITSYSYDPKHHFVTVKQGDDSKVTLEQTTFTDTLGHPVLIRRKLDSGYATVKNIYDKVGNLVTKIDERGYGTGYDYDGLNRLAILTEPGGIVTSFQYDAAGNMILRDMPGPADWHALYDSAGRMTDEWLAQASGKTRYKSYNYHTSGDAIGMLEQVDESQDDAATVDVTHAYTYDDNYRIQTYTATGHTGAASVETHYVYDWRNLLTEVTRGPPSGADSVSRVAQVYDAYGQLIHQAVEQGAGLSHDGGFTASDMHSQLTQRWDSMGRRSSLQKGADFVEVDDYLATTVFDPQFSFDYEADGQLATIHTPGGALELSHSYANNRLHTGTVLRQNYSYDDGKGNVTKANSILKELKTPLFGYDVAGRLKTRSQYAGISQTSALTTESLTYYDDDRIDTYADTHGNGNGGSWSHSADSRSYTYSGRGKLTSEAFVYTPLASGDQRLTKTLDYGFDAGDADGSLGVVTSVTATAELSGGGSTVNTLYDQPAGLGTFARAGEESLPGSFRSFSATGTTYGPGQFQLYLAKGSNPDSGDFQEVGSISPKPGIGDGTWHLPLRLVPGEYSLQAKATHTTSAYEVKDTVQFTIDSGESRPVTSSYDSFGRLESRTWGTPDADGTRVVQTFSWDALGNLLSVVLTDDRLEALPDGSASAKEQPYSWSADYDAIGRRVQTSYTVDGETHITRAWFDPSVEFLEVAVEQGGERFWKLHGLDLNSSYGGLNGTGGLEALIAESSGSVFPLIDNYFGHIIARVDTQESAEQGDDTVLWSASLAGGYGMLPGYTAEPAESVGLVQSLLWQGRRLDPTGFYCIGKRYYSPEGGRFISADPLGHAATPDLYSFAGGDPINKIDPDGRFNVSAFQNQNNLWSAPQGFNQWRQIQRDDRFRQQYEAKWARDDARAQFSSRMYQLGNTWAGQAVRSFVPFAESAYQLSQGNVGAAVGYALVDAASFGAGYAIGASAKSARFASGAYRASSRAGGASIDYLEHQFSRSVTTNRGGQFGDEFQGLLGQIRKADFSTKKDGAVFWTGYHEGNQTAAINWAKATGKDTIEMTSGGKWLNDLNLYKTSNLNRSEIDHLWRAASAQFARGASGKVNAFTRGTSTDLRKVFYGLELKLLKKNTAVSPRITYRGY
jgi:RHS repeat-associated protein